LKAGKPKLVPSPKHNVEDEIKALETCLNNRKLEELERIFQISKRNLRKLNSFFGGE
jgi:hypothetical protein